MIILKRALCFLGAVGALAACSGGGGASGTSGFGGSSGGGGTTPPVVASDLILQTTSTQLPNTAASSVGITVTAIDAKRVVVSGANVSLSADNDAVVSQSAATTDATGQVTGTLGIGSNRANRLITITATSGTVSKTVQVQVVGTRISATLVPAVVAPSAAATIQYRVVDQTGNPMVSQAISISAPGLTPASATGTTGANGDYVFSYTAPAAGGSFPVAASVGGLTDTETVTVQAAANVPPIATAITSASVSANPSVVGVNQSGSTTNRAEIRALFLSAGNAPVKNVRVRFDTAGDPNQIGGSFTTGSTGILYSDANGVVTTAYVPGSRSSPTNGLTVRACYGSSDTDPNLINCTTYAVVSLTVVSEPLGVSIGTNELIIGAELTYTKRFLISVADSAGNAKPDVALSVSLDLPQYRKGTYVLSGLKWVQNQTAVCLNEDTNRNGVLEAGKDLNGNGRLDPGRSDVTVRLLSARTGADGTAIAEVTYAKSFGGWVDAWITVAASGVAGTEGRATYVLAPVPVEAAAISNVAVTPAFVVSPYGQVGSCTNPN